MSSGYANKYGLANSQIDYVIGGTKVAGAPYVTRPAPPVPPNLAIIKEGEIEQMDDLYIFLKQLSNRSYQENEFLLSYALTGWLSTQPSSSTEGMSDLELILKQYKSGKSIVVKKQVEECLRYIDDWFRKWNGRD